MGCRPLDTLPACHGGRLWPLVFYELKSSCTLLIDLGVAALFIAPQKRWHGREHCLGPVYLSMRDRQDPLPTFLALGGARSSSACVRPGASQKRRSRQSALHRPGEGSGTANFRLCDLAGRITIAKGWRFRPTRVPAPPLLPSRPSFRQRSAREARLTSRVTPMMFFIRLARRR